MQKAPMYSPVHQNHSQHDTVNLLHTPPLWQSAESQESERIRKGKTGVF